MLLLLSNKLDKPFKRFQSQGQVQGHAYDARVCVTERVNRVTACSESLSYILTLKSVHVSM